MADVLERAPFDQAGAHRQGGCGPLQGLQAGHLVDTVRLDPGGGALGCQAVGLADILALRRELRIARGVDPAAHPMRLEVDLAQKPPDGVRRDGRDDAARDGFRGQIGVGPLGQLTSVALRWLAGERDNRADLLRREGRRRPRTRRVDQSLEDRRRRRCARPTPSPALHRRPTNAETLHRCPHADAARGQEDDLRTPDQALRRVALAHHRFKNLTIFLRNVNRGGGTKRHQR